MEASETLRGLIDSIVLIPEKGRLRIAEIDLHWHDLRHEAASFHYDQGSLDAPSASPWGAAPTPFLSSSTAEHPAVNRRVAGSNPA